VFPLARAKFRMAVNRALPLTPRRVLFFSAFCFFGASFVLLDYLFFFRIFNNLFAIRGLPEQAALALSAKLMGLVFLTTYTMLVFSAAVSALSYLYMDSDLALLFGLPLGRGGIRASKLVQTFFNASSMVCLLVLPVIASYMAVRRGGGLMLALLPAAGFCLYAAAPAAWGASVTIVLSRFFPARKLHQFFTVLGLALLTMLVLFFRLARPEKLMNPRASGEMEELLASIALPSEKSLPSTWLARLVVSAAEGDLARAALNLSRLAVLAGLSLALLWLLARALHSRGYGRSEERGAAGIVKNRRGILLPALRLIPLGKDARAVIYRDVLSFFRSPAEWGQLFILAALLFIYLFNVRYMPREIAPFRVAVTLLNFVTLCFVTASVSARFAFTSIGWEGKAFFTSRALPIGPGMYVLAKFIFTGAPLAFFSGLAFFFAGRLIELDGWPFAFFMAASVAAALFFTAFAVYMGTRSPLFDERNPARMLVTPEGFLYMFFSMVYVGLLAVLAARPVYAHYIMMLSGVEDREMWLKALAGMLAATSPAALMLFMAARKVSSTEQK